VITILPEVDVDGDSVAPMTDRINSMVAKGLVSSSLLSHTAIIGRELAFLPWWP
jgi:hypothetical protein